MNIARGAYAGPIDLDIRGLAPKGGVTAIPGVIPAGQALGLVGLKADPASRFDTQDIQVVGKRLSGQAVAAARTIVFAQQTSSTPGFGMTGTIPGYWRPFVSLTAAVTRPGPIALYAGDAKLVVPQGGTVEVPVHIVRDGAATAKFQIVALAPPTGLSVTSSEVIESTRSSGRAGHGGGGRTAGPPHARPGRDSRGAEGRRASAVRVGHRVGPDCGGSRPPRGPQVSEERASESVLEFLKRRCVEL